MSALLYEAHLFRTTVPHSQRGLEVQFPVTGIVLVPETVEQIDNYIVSRMQPLAQLRVVETRAVRGNVYVDTMAALMTRSAARIIGNTEAIDRIPHTRPARDCQRCRFIALCSMDDATYQASREQFEILCSRIRIPLSEPELQALEYRLNSPGLQH